MKETISELKQEREKLLLRVKDIDEFIKAYQKVCAHNWKYDGHDSHKDFYICTSCGEEKDV